MLRNETQQLFFCATKGGREKIERLLKEFEVPFSAPTVWGGNQPMLSDQMFIQAAGVGGDRLVTTLRNPTGGTLAYTALAIIQPAGTGRRR